MSNLDPVGVVYTTNNLNTSDYQNHRNKEQLVQNAVSPSAEGEALSMNLDSQHSSREELESVVSTLNEIGESRPPHLKFIVDDDTGRTVITVTHRETGELLRQIPSDEFLRIARMVQENNQSLSERPGQWIELNA